MSSEESTTGIDYSKYTTEELLEMHRQAKHEENSFNVSQLVKKILLNSLYGSCANKFFLYYCRDMARAITLLGRTMINKAGLSTNTFISNVLGESEVKERRVAGDTDSVTGDTILRLKTDNEEYVQTIEEFFKTYNEFIKKDEENKNYVKTIDDNTSSLTVIDNGKKLEYTPVKYVMKHSVKKRMYTLSVNGKKVKITEDHSLICLRDGNLVSVKPYQLQKGDSIISLEEE